MDLKDFFHLDFQQSELLIRGEFEEREEMRFHGDQKIDGNLEVNGDLDLDGKALIKGDLKVLGNCEVHGDLVINGALTCIQQETTQVFEDEGISVELITEFPPDFTILSEKAPYFSEGMRTQFEPFIACRQ